MTDIILCGCCGKMGRVINDCLSAREDCRIVAGIDISGVKYADFPVYQTVSEVTQKADVIIDFSHPSALSDILEYAKANGLGAVIATTGLDKEHIELVNNAAKAIPVFFTYNMSLGVNLLAELAKKAAEVLGGFDIEIVEAHHNQKLDAPSGTALMLADAVIEGSENEKELVYDRHSRRAKREKKEIGMHAIRGGTIVGEHQIIFAGRDEIVTLSHSARSKEIFATGAISAAIYLKGKQAGLYNMSDMLK